jgi:hypothetical protein
VSGPLSASAFSDLLAATPVLGSEFQAS